ncbi:hypothetical protein [Beduini massiliensis]|uniref:hypothetical protein n=1 Tax=Beduini massiliensis TaxID=1585974 RepID=UPI00059A8EBA|nr:hypothetical protein [Beduini massiliensis]
MKKRYGKYSIIVLMVLILMLGGCSIEGKVRFLRVSITETILNLHSAKQVWVNDMVNEQHYQIDQFNLEVEEGDLEKVENNDGYDLILEFSAYYFGRYYHLQLFKQGESYIIGTVCFMAGKSIPLTYSNQTYYAASAKMVEQLMRNCKTFEEDRE